MGNGQYIHFHSFVPQFEAEPNYMTQLKQKGICTDDILEAELQTVERLFIENSFYSRLLDKVMETEN